MIRYQISHFFEFLTKVLTHRTSLKIFLAKNYPSLFKLETFEGEVLRWDGVKFEAPRLDGYFTRELLEVLGERWYSLKHCDVEKGDVVIDAGAHFGFFSYYAIKNGAERVYAFEPNPYVFEILKKHAEMWSPKIIPISLALSNKKGKITLNVEENKLSGVSTVLNNKSREFSILRKFKYVESLNVDATTIDDFVSEQNLNRVDFIKIDVEGAEKEVIEGAKETIKKFKPKLAISAYHNYAVGYDEKGKEIYYPSDMYEIPCIVKSFRNDYKKAMKMKLTDHFECVVFMW